MIVPMMKVHLLVHEPSHHQALLELRELGLFHVEKRPIDPKGLEDLSKTRVLLEKAINVLSQFRNGSEDIGKSSSNEIAFLEDHIVSEIIELDSLLSTINENIKNLVRQKQHHGRLLQIKEENVEELKNKGVFIFIYRLHVDIFKTLHKPYLFTINRSRKEVLFAQVCFDEDQKLEYPEERLPHETLEDIDIRLQRGLSEKEEMEGLLSEYTVHYANLKRGLSEIRERLNLETVRLSSVQTGSIRCLSGYVPERDVPSLRSAAATHGWGLMVHTPGPSENPPTLIHYSRPFRIVKPIFDVLETLPGYRERDISGFFLLFFCVFFAMIIGDAGYGSIFLCMATVAITRRYVKRTAVPPLYPLAWITALCTMVWGALTGNWFGSCRLCEDTILSHLVVPELYSFNAKSTESVMLVCFSLGFLQISIAHIWNFLLEVRRKPYIRAFSQLGWLASILGLYFLTLSMLLGSENFPKPPFTLQLILTGYISVLILSKQEDRFYRGILVGMSNFIPITLNMIGSFSDIISYIRLFAVGLASLNIAVSFNQMAQIVPLPFSYFISPVILLIGHSLNMLMGMLSVIVHGIRLNMLEFSSHLGMEWNGYSYRPFQNHNAVHLD